MSEGYTDGARRVVFSARAQALTPALKIRVIKCGQTFPLLSAITPSYTELECSVIETEKVR